MHLAWLLLHVSVLFLANLRFRGAACAISGCMKWNLVFYALRRWPGEVHVAMVTLHGEQMQQIEEILAEENPAFGKGSAMWPHQRSAAGGADGLVGWVYYYFCDVVEIYLSRLVGDMKASCQHSRLVVVSKREEVANVRYAENGTLSWLLLELLSSSWVYCVANLGARMKVSRWYCYSFKALHEHRYFFRLFFFFHIS